MPEITVRGPSGPPVSHRFDKDAVTIGRGAANDLVVRDPKLSRRHVEIKWEGEGWVVSDCRSRNGTLLNGRPLRRPEALAAGDEIAIGQTVLVFAAAVAGAVKGGEPDTLPSAWSSRGSGTADDDLELVGSSPAARAVLAQVTAVAPLSSTVLLLGENGTGKELVARLLHRRSPRARAPFVVVNCPALPATLVEAELFGVEKGVATGVEPRKGKLEAAHGGTLLLDEVGDLDPAAQAKLLRFLQERTVERLGGREPIAVDVRLVAATNRDLEAAIAAGSFRRDLYHRLDVVSIRLPPLRERREDVPGLVRHFLARDDWRRMEVSPEAMALLERHDWPGNVRELEHALERAQALAPGPVVRPEDLPEAVRRGPQPRPAAAVAAPSPAAGPRDPATVADALYERVVRGGESFWELVREPFLRRELSRDEARRLVRRAHREAGGEYKQVAAMFRIPGQYKKLMSFLRNHALRVEDAE